MKQINLKAWRKFRRRVELKANAKSIEIRKATTDLRKLMIATILAED